MKRVIKASSFKKIDGYSFTRKLINKINELNPNDETGYWVQDKSNPWGYNFIIEGVGSFDEVTDAVEEALESMGYTNIYDITGCDPDEKVDTTSRCNWAVVDQNDAWVKLTIEYNYYYSEPDKMGIVFLDFDNGNVIFEDWYED